VSLPIYPEPTEDPQKRVVDAIVVFFKGPIRRGGRL